MNGGVITNNVANDAGSHAGVYGHSPLTLSENSVINVNTSVALTNNENQDIKFVLDDFDAYYYRENNDSNALITLEDSFKPSTLVRGNATEISQTASTSPESLSYILVENYNDDIRPLVLIKDFENGERAMQDVTKYFICRGQYGVHLKMEIFCIARTTIFLRSVFHLRKVELSIITELAL